MTGMDREYVTPRELAAEIRAIEERMDRRHAEIGGKIDVLATSINSAVEKITTEVKSANERVVSTQRDLEGNFAKLDNKIDQKYEDVIKSNKGNRIAIILTVIASFLAGVGAIWATNANIMAAIERGRNTAQGIQPDADPKRPFEKGTLAG